MSQSVNDLFEALGEVGAEVARARDKFPSNAHLMAALAEEVGELAKELLEKGAGPSVRAEAMQVACVAVRIMTEGDEDFAGPAGLPKKPSGGSVQKPARRKVGRPRKTPAPKSGPAKQDDPKPPAANPTCELCGDAFVRTGPRQKYCAACAAKRDAASKAAWLERKRAAERDPSGRNPGATQERLERIRAANERLDRIPDEPGKGGSGQ